MFSDHWWLQRSVWLLVLIAGWSFGCQSRRSPTGIPPANSTSTSVPAPNSAAPLDNPFALPLQSTPNLPYESVPMALPQPLPEPTPAEDPSQYEPANPPWPTEFTEVYGSELVAKIKDVARSRGVKGVLINAWASWCGPCKVEMPMLLDVRQRYLAKGLDVWFVSVDKSEHATQVSEVLRERNVPPPHYVVRGRVGYFKEALSPIWKGSLPSTFLFDATGRLRYYWGAHVFENELTPLLDDFLEGKLVDGVANFKVRRGPPAP